MGNRQCEQSHGYSPQVWDCWKDNIVKKTGGFWYSTVSAGYCGPGQSASADGGPCMWRVQQEVKKIAKNCSDDRIYTLVEQEGARCFEHCNLPPPGRNVTDPCWIHCFYDTVLGPDAGKEGGALAGMPLAKLLATWNESFAPGGGCPSI